MTSALLDHIISVSLLELFHQGQKSSQMSWSPSVEFLSVTEHLETTWTAHCSSLSSKHRSPGKEGGNYTLVTMLHRYCFSTVIASSQSVRVANCLKKITSYPFNRESLKCNLPAGVT